MLARALKRARTLEGPLNNEDSEDPASSADGASSPKGASSAGPLTYTSILEEVRGDPNNKVALKRGDWWNLSHRIQDVFYKNLHESLKTSMIENSRAFWKGFIESYPFTDDFKGTVQNEVSKFYRDFEDETGPTAVVAGSKQARLSVWFERCTRPEWLSLHFEGAMRYVDAFARNNGGTHYVSIKKSREGSDYTHIPHNWVFDCNKVPMGHLVGHMTSQPGGICAPVGLGTRPRIDGPS